MGTHIIIDARTRKVHASLDAPGEGTTIFAVDLIGDTWEDFLHFTEEARVAERANELSRRNRCIRAAIAMLFSHLDGVISDILKILWSDRSFIRYKPRSADFCSLKRKLLAIHTFLVDHRGLTAQRPALDLKLLRDILNHPTVTKPLSATGSRETVPLNSTDVYGVCVDDLEAAGRAIDQWFNAVCVIVPYERFRDTKRIVEDFAGALGGQPTSTRRF